MVTPEWEAGGDFDRGRAALERRGFVEQRMAEHQDSLLR